MDKVKKPFYKKWWFIGIIVLIVIGGIGNALDGEEEVKDKLEKVEISAPVKEESAETKAVTDTEKKEKEEAEQKKSASAEKEHYVNEVVPQLEGVIGVYDKIWTDIWQPTFEGLSDGSVDAYTAYESMKDLEQRYTALDKQISDINGDKLSKDNKKTLDEFKSEFRNAASLRRSSGNEAKKMIDKGTFSPSEVDKVMTTVGYSEAPMLKAVVSKTTLDMEFGLTEEE